MSRTPETFRSSVSAISSAGAHRREAGFGHAALSTPGSPDLWMARAAFTACVAALAYALAPFRLGAGSSVGLGISVGAAIVAAEMLLRRVKLNTLLGAAAGALLGASAGALCAFVISRTAAAESAKAFLEYGALLGFGYLGWMLGADKGNELNAKTLRGLSEERATSVSQSSVKLLDTSVLIDGRVADICDAQFLDGTLLVPQFVLHELQLVADSADGLRRQRGRRGLDVVERMQKMPGITLRILDDVSVTGGDVDHKLVELARRMGAKIVTNDFNLNKVATVQGLSVLNVNQLANALKPAVLPGEPMRVLILREGKEASQGVAYLDDGTMVVVDGARRCINKTIDILVTSVHQTAAGKMIFGRMEERGEAGTAAPLREAAAAGASANRAADSAILDRAPGATFRATPRS